MDELLHPSALQNGSDVNDGMSRSRSAALATLLFVLFLTFLDNTIVTVVLANVQSELHASVSQLQWVVNGYALTFASLMLSFGTIGDLFGRKKVMLTGVAVFCAGSVIAAVAPTTNILIAGRVVMGIGAAASEPGTLSMIRHLYPGPRERARSLGIWAAVSSLGLALGPLIGGLLVFGWSWRAIFWFNVFFGVLAFTSAAIVLPESSDPVRARFDIPGFLLGAVALGSLTFAIILGETAGYRTWWIDLLFFFSLAAAITFVFAELRAANPVLNVRYFKRSAFASSNIIAFTVYFGTFAIFFMVALYLQVVGSKSPLGLALNFVPLAIGMVVSSLLAGRWVAAWGPRIPMATGCLLAGLGILLTNANITPQAGIGQIGWTMFVAGVGVGMALVPVTSAALGTVPAEHSGMAASANNTFRELGAVVGVAVLGSIVNGQLTVNLVQKLTAIGIPKSFQQLVVSAVTTGTYQSQAKAATAKSPAITHIVNEVISAAYGAFGHGLNLSLNIAGGLLLASAILALSTVYGRRIHLERVNSDEGHLLHLSVVAAPVTSDLAEPSG
ncbi:MAG TPA: MFS transporter [Acidimicrobiales bacterium]|jgi:EmrB/QacA subfamily drug resistance transporter|nr:MFS transporter [Acidimicrobiales bacterium]